MGNHELNSIYTLTSYDNPMKTSIIVDDHQLNEAPFANMEIMNSYLI
jgi:hypothetical protein